jgi:MscS family membrane protein
MKLTRGLSFSIVASACLLLPILLAAPADAQVITFIQIGDREQECPASDSVEYKWFLYNDYPTTMLLQVSANQSSGRGWSSEIDQPIMIIDYQESAIITLTVSAESDATSKSVNQTVSFNFTDLNNTYGSFTVQGYANTKLIPAWGVIAPGKNKLLGRFDTPLPEPFNSNYFTFALNMGIWAVIALFVAFVVDPIAHLVTKKTKSDVDDRILKVLRKPIFFLIIIYGLVSSLTILPLTDGEVATVFEFYGIALIAIVTFVGYKVFKEVLVFIGRRWASKTSTELDDVLVPVIDKIGGVVILIFGAVGVISYMGYDITFLLAGVGVMGLVIAFAAQDALSNFFSGIMLLLDRPFSEGDYVSLTTGELCRVERIGLRSTRLYDTFSNNLIVLPNNKVVNDKLVNLTEPTVETIHEIAVSAVYGTDVGKVEKIMMDLATKHKEVLKDPGKEPSVRFNAFGDSGMEFKLYFWVGDFMVKYRVAHELRKEIEKRFSEEKIEIAYPHRTVFIKESPKK